MATRRLAVGLCVLTLAVGACGGNKPRAESGPTNRLTITGTEYRFGLDKLALKEGTAQVTFRNTGVEYHMAGWAKLKGGVTFDRFSQTLRTRQDEAFGLIAQADDGSPNILSPGQSTTIITNLLTAGTYALLCFIPAPDKNPHLAKGMLSSFDVRAAGTTPPARVDVKTDGEVTMTDHKFGTIPPALKTGKGTFKFSNRGKEAHEMVIARFEPGKGFKDADTYFKAFEDAGVPPTGAPPLKLVGGFFAIPPGASIWVVVDLTPGSYGLNCGEQTESGKKHDEDLGMRTTFTVA